MASLDIQDVLEALEGRIEKMELSDFQQQITALNKNQKRLEGMILLVRRFVAEECMKQEDSQTLNFLE